MHKIVTYISYTYYLEQELVVYDYSIAMVIVYLQRISGYRYT